MIKKRLFLGMLVTSFIYGCSAGGGGNSTPTYTIGGTVTGLNGTLVLQNNGSDDLTITANGSFTFSTRLPDGSTYNVTILTQPTGQTCFIKNGSGTVSGSNVTNIEINCHDSGTLDPTFGSNGIVFHNNATGGNWRDRGNSVITDRQGRILVTGFSRNSSGDRDMVIWRFNPDGTLDTSFGTNGVVVHHNAAGGNGHDTGFSIVLDSQGRILVTGYSENSSGNYDMVIWRFNSDGTLDNSFGTNGVVVYDNTASPGSYDTGYSLTLDSQERILVAGRSNGTMAIWRLNRDGTFDTTFDSDGIVLYDDINFLFQGNSITIDSQGRILVTGYRDDYNGLIGNGFDMIIWRYNSDGTLDTSFGTNGVVVHNNAAGGNGTDVGRSITLDSQGRILVTGYSENSSSNHDMVIWRFNSDGTLDTSFGTNGVVVHHNAAGGNEDDEGRSIIVDGQSRILVAGSSWNSGGNHDMVIWRFNSDGTLDTSFGTNGAVVHHNAAGGNRHDRGFSIVLDSQGRILVTGHSRNSSGDDDMVIWRFIP